MGQTTTKVQAPRLGEIKGAWKWRQFFEYDYLSAYDIDNQDLIVTIKNAKYEEVTGEKGRKDKCIVLYFNEIDKGMVMNVTNSKRITVIYNTPVVEKWYGKRIQLYAEQTSLKGEPIMGLRVREFEPKDKTASELGFLNTQIRKALGDYDGLGKEEIKAFLRKCQQEKKTSANLYRETISALTVLNEKQKGGELTQVLFDNLFEDLKSHA